MSTHTPTIALIMLKKIKRWNGFSATIQVKARLYQTKPLNALPALWHYLSRHSSSAKADPTQPRMLWEIFSFATSSSQLVMAATTPATSIRSRPISRIGSLEHCVWRCSCVALCWASWGGTWWSNSRRLGADCANINHWWKRCWSGSSALRRSRFHPKIGWLSEAA